MITATAAPFHPPSTSQSTTSQHQSSSTSINTAIATLDASIKSHAQRNHEKHNTANLQIGLLKQLLTQHTAIIDRQGGQHQAFAYGVTECIASLDDRVRILEQQALADRDRISALEAARRSQELDAKLQGLQIQYLIDSYAGLKDAHTKSLDLGIRLDDCEEGCIRFAAATNDSLRNLDHGLDGVKRAISGLRSSAVTDVERASLASKHLDGRLAKLESKANEHSAPSDSSAPSILEIQPRPLRFAKIYLVNLDGTTRSGNKVDVMDAVATLIRNSRSCKRERVQDLVDLNQCWVSYTAKLEKGGPGFRVSRASDDLFENGRVEVNRAGEYIDVSDREVYVTAGY